MSRYNRSSLDPTKTWYVGVIYIRNVDYDE